MHILNEPQVNITSTFFSSLLLNPSSTSQASLSEQWRYQVQFPSLRRIQRRSGRIIVVGFIPENATVP